MSTDREELIRRYLDDELEADARRAFEARLAADAALRHEVEGLRRLLDEARALPRHQAPPELAQRV
ncbi:MAG TPA: hypothetical protein VNM66_07290, partial [Thermodesulfobacteriota bacterium]|nr:hypothetical protein [Thermodesulfobacteriota bacterium]